MNSFVGLKGIEKIQMMKVRRCTPGKVEDLFEDRIAIFTCVFVAMIGLWSRIRKER